MGPAESIVVAAKGLWRKRLSSTSFRACLDAPAPQSFAAGELVISGWAFSTVEPIVRVSAFFDEISLGGVHYGIERPDVALEYPGRGSAASGFAGRFDLPPSARGSAVVRVEVTSKSGATYVLSAPIMVGESRANQSVPSAGGAQDPDTGEALSISSLRSRAMQFRTQLEAIKVAQTVAGGWYPYGSINNFIHLEALLRGENRSIFSRVKTVADIGAADGDIAFFLESLGFDVDVVDHAPSNFNQLAGVHALARALHSRVTVHDIDLDSQFRLPRTNYDLVFFLGILYHLKNPFFVLEQLARSTRHCLISTRVTRYAPDRRTRLRDLPVAYLLGPSESNNDATNFWIFSEAGLRRILDRAGWDLVEYMSVGNTKDSDPSSGRGDERAFCLIRSRNF